MLTISKEIKNIQNTFKSYFKNNKSNFDLNNMGHTTISILGLLHVFTEKNDDYKNNIDKYNKDYYDLISQLDVNFCNEYHIYSVIHFFNEEVQFYDFYSENYKFLSNSVEIIKLSNRILKKNKIDKNFKYYDFFKKMAIFITVKYLINHEITKNQVKINLFFNGCNDFVELLSKEILFYFKYELEVFYGDDINYVIIENAICEVNENLFLLLAENEIYNLNENDNKKFDLIYKIIDFGKFNYFVDCFLKNNSKCNNINSTKTFKFIIFQIFNEIIKFR